MSATQYYNKYVVCFDIAEAYYKESEFEAAKYWYQQADNWFLQYEYAMGYKYDDCDYDDYIL